MGLIISITRVAITRKRVNTILFYGFLLQLRLCFPVLWMRLSYRRYVSMKGVVSINGVASMKSVVSTNGIASCMIPSQCTTGYLITHRKIISVIYSLDSGHLALFPNILVYVNSPYPLPMSNSTDSPVLWGFFTLWHHRNTLLLCLGLSKRWLTEWQMVSSTARQIQYVLHYSPRSWLAIWHRMFEYVSFLYGT